MSAFRASSAALSAFRATPRASFVKPKFQPHIGDTLNPQYAMKWVPSLGIWGATAGMLVTILFSGVPLFQHDVLDKTPVAWFYEEVSNARNFQFQCEAFKGILSNTVLNSLAYGRVEPIGHIRLYLSACKPLSKIRTAHRNRLATFVTIKLPRVPVLLIRPQTSFGFLYQTSTKRLLPTTRNDLSFASQQKLRYSSKVAMPFQQALPDSLLDRNQSWSKAFETDQPDIAQALREGQHPKVLWLGCSDSRVPESVVCNARPGELFVLRNVANQFHLHDDSAVSALTFAVQALGVEHIIVVGHTSCGGVAAAVKQVMREQNEKTSDLLPNTALNRHLTPLIGLARYSYIKLHERHSMGDEELQERLMRLVTEASVRQQIQNIVDHPVVQDNWSEKESPLNGKVNPRVTLHGWIHNLGTSQLLDLNVTVSPPPLQEKSKSDS